MNRLFQCLVLCFALYPSTLTAQVSQYCIAVKELIADHSTRTLPYFELMIDNNRKKADQDGNIYFNPESSHEYVSISMINEAQYVLIGSANVPLPADQKQSVTIVVRKPNQKEQAVTQTSHALQRLNIQIAAFDSMKKYDNAQYQEKMRLLDSVLKNATTQYSISPEDLRSATEKLQGRDKYFDPVASSLEHYLNEAKDIRDIFKQLLLFSLDNPKYFKLLDSSIMAYNFAYNTLNDHHDEYQQAVLQFWNSKELSLNYYNTYDFAINNLHRGSILPLNNLFNQPAREYVQEKNERKRKALKQEIITSLNAVTPVLDNSLTILEAKIRDFVGALQAQINVYSN